MGRVAGILNETYQARKAALNKYQQEVEARKSAYHKAMLPLDPENQYELPEPGVLLKRQFRRAKNPEHRKDGKYVDFSIFATTPMQDWDFPDEIHDASSVNIRHAGDALDRLNKFVKDKPDSNFRVYLTPGGVRSFDMTRQATPRRYVQEGYDKILQVDPNYINLAQNLSPSYGTEGFEFRQGWGSRVSGKPKRADDFVAYYLGSVGKGLPHPENIRQVHTYHDKKIAESIAKEGMNSRILPESGIQLLSQQVKTLDKDFAGQVLRRMAGLGVDL